jgi:hypothetical protein
MKMKEFMRAVEIIEEFFGVTDEVEDENLVPKTDGGMFTFGVASEKFTEGFMVDGTSSGFDFSSGFDM